MPKYLETGFPEMLMMIQDHDDDDDDDKGDEGHKHVRIPGTWGVETSRRDAFAFTSEHQFRNRN